MGVGRVLGLLLLVPTLVVLLTMPGARASCGEGEYSHQNRCCVLCEAGTFVADHCNASHARGKCDLCKEGTFRAHENGLEECSACRQCKEGQKILHPCTQTNDTECQCEQGLICADDACDWCQVDNQTRPGKREVTPNSTDATDSGLPSQGNGVAVWIFPVILVILALVLLIIFVIKRKCNKAASTNKDAEGGLVQEPSQIILKDLSQSELSETFDVFVKEVSPQQWKPLMRTLLQENDIDKVISKFPDNRQEQSYQMLFIWKKRLGKKQCIINLLDELRHIDIEVYYNISNTLKSNNIISKVEAED